MRRHLGLEREADAQRDEDGAVDEQQHDDRVPAAAVGAHRVQHAARAVRHLAPWRQGVGGERCERSAVSVNL